MTGIRMREVRFKITKKVEASGKVLFILHENLAWPKAVLWEHIGAGRSRKNIKRLIRNIKKMDKAA